MDGLRQRPKTSRVWAVVPVKRLKCAKERLGDVLSEQDRMVLAQCMLGDVLRRLAATTGLAGIAVVTADPVVQTVARAFHARVVPDVCESGVNDAVRQGLETLSAPGETVLVVPADIPLATVADFEAIIALLDVDPVVLAPALSDGGTNALAMRAPTLVPPQFGDRSFERHRLSAAERGLCCGVFRSNGIGRDIDVASDLLAVLATPDDGGDTASLLRRWDHEGRLRASRAIPAGRPS